MPSRRGLLAALGTGAAGVVAGCTGTDTTTGLVSRKWITAAVPRRGAEPMDASVALLAFEPDRGLVHGEYDPAYVDAAVDGGTLSVPEGVHDRLTDRFAAVRYSANVVPTDGTTPANGVLGRRAFNRLSLGGTATVGTYVGDDGYGRLRVRETTPREGDPSEVTVGTFDLAERVDGA